MEDNFYQASSERLIPTPKAQADKIKKDKIAYNRERPLITSVMDRLEKAISDREKIDAIKDTKNPENFMREVEVNKQVCAILRSELAIIKTAVKKFDKEVKPEEDD
jgi:hypothetical protein